MALAAADTLLEAIEIRMADDARRGAEPGTLSGLHLPPTFVADHAVRALAYQRIEVPWHAASILFGATAALLPSGLRDAFAYQIDIAELAEEALVEFLTLRLPDAGLFAPASIEGIARQLERQGLATRTGAANVAAYLGDRAAYAGARFVLDPATLERAIGFADGRGGHATRGGLRAAS